MTDLDRALEEQILRLLAHRDAGKTICISEAARVVDPDTARGPIRVRSAR